LIDVARVDEQGVARDNFLGTQFSLPRISSLPSRRGAGLDMPVGRAELVVVQQLSGRVIQGGADRCLLNLRAAMRNVLNHVSLSLPDGCGNCHGTKRSA
jgi:hypothetical protein